MLGKYQSKQSIFFSFSQSKLSLTIQIKHFLIAKSVVAISVQLISKQVL